MRCNLTSFPKVSVLIPVVNGENFLESAIRSALDQDYPNLEIIIGINPSEDKTFEIAESFSGDSRIKIVNFSEAVNMPSNFNRTGSYATGEFLRFLCHDDFIPPDSISRLTAGMLLNRRVAISVGYESFLGIHRNPRDDRALGSQDLVRGSRVIRRLIRYGNWIGGPSAVMIRNSDFARTKFDESLECAFDLDYWIKLATRGDLVVVRKTCLFTRNHQNQATNKCLEGGFKDDLQKIYSRLKIDKKVGGLNRLIACALR